MSKNLIALQNRFLGLGDTVYDRLARLKAEKGHISADDISALAKTLSLPTAHVRTVAHFYDELVPSDAAPKAAQVRVCNGEACAVAGGGGCKQRLAAALQDADIGDVTCVGRCGSGPNALVTLDHHETVVSLPDDASLDALISSIEAKEQPRAAAPNAVYLPPEGKPNVLLRSFIAAGGRLKDAEAVGAYQTLGAALEGDPESIIDAVKASQLRGRGGAGFPAGIKLATVRSSPSSSGERYVVLNADEGDAGAYIDKELLDRAAHTVIEGMILAAYAVGANEGWVYLRGEYPRSLEVFGLALQDARDAGYLGDDILNSGFSFHVHLVRGHGAYICGEETSLLRSLEGVPAQVTPKPPYPAVEGLRGAPTLVNNVETIANLPFIVQHGGAKYAEHGYEKSRGTKLVSLNSVVERPGLYEVELGTTLRELIFDLAGGMADGKTFKAVQVGGPLGGIFNESKLDLPLDFDALASAGGLLGHAGVVVYPDEVDLVEIGRGLMRFCAVESCGKCFPCRLGSVRGAEVFDKILDGRGAQSDLDLLAELSETMRYGSLCALGGAIPIPIDNLLTWFVSEFDKHIPGAQIPDLLNILE